jgi:hypothetical protein
MKDVNIIPQNNGIVNSETIKEGSNLPSIEYFSEITPSGDIVITVKVAGEDYSREFKITVSTKTPKVKKL